MTDYHWIAIKRAALALVSLSLVAVVACGGARVAIARRGGRLRWRSCGPSRR